MKSAELTKPSPDTVKNENIIHLPLGLLGFESIKKYVLLSKPEEAPFSWLQMLDDPNLAFLVVPPLATIPNYQPDIPAEDVDFVGFTNCEDVLVFNIVTLRGHGKATVNLKGPIVLNRKTLVGKQVVPLNAAQYSLQHPLSV